MTVVALTIAGSDPSGGAGVQADLKTFHQHVVYGTGVLTLLTVQNTQTVSEVRVLEADFVIRQLEAVVSDIAPAAAKTGALGAADTISALGARAPQFDFPLVVDPVMISKHGAPLIDEDAVEVFRRELLRHAFLITPNLHEASRLTGRVVETIPQMESAARELVAQGAQHALVKGGHLKAEAMDLLLSDGQIHRFPSPRIETKHTHGTGCVYSLSLIHI